tara:strand:+ start:1094 stop:1663 length:570 start_codon:yes stop_codon:yes gene_type:complete
LKPLRTFIAVNVSQDTCRVAGRLIKQLAAVDDGVRTVQNQNLHITLKFLGEVLVEETPAICNAVERACESLSSFEISCGGLGAFPEQDRPRTLWLGVHQGQQEMRALQHRVDQETQQLGYSGENRLYVPHLTLARIRHFQGDPEKLQQLFDLYNPGPLTETSVTEVITYASFMERGLPRYEVLGRTKLK